MVTGNPRQALIGYDRNGNNENSNSIVALDLNSRKILWKFQDVKHDLWDYDIAHPPIIHDINFGDKIYPSVITVGKTGNIHIINRYTGNIFMMFTIKVPLNQKFQERKQANFKFF